MRCETCLKRTFGPKCTPQHVVGNFSIYACHLDARAILTHAHHLINHANHLINRSHFDRCNRNLCGGGGTCTPQPDLDPYTAQGLVFPIFPVIFSYCNTPTCCRCAAFCRVMEGTPIDACPTALVKCAANPKQCIE